MTTKNPHDHICVALDTPSLAVAERLLDELQPVGLRSVKTGYHLLYSCDGGPPAVAAMLDRRGLMDDSLVDPKFDDTPETVAEGILGVRGNGFRRFTIHVGSGPASLEACMLNQGDTTPVGVTLLTSIDKGDLAELGYAPKLSPLDIVRLRIRLALRFGITTIVCSPLELMAFREGDEFPDVEFWTPGVRPAGAAATGQKRFATPTLAVQAKARKIIIGGPVARPPHGTSADAYVRICDEVAAAL